MSDHESFEDRLRAIADEVSKSVQRISEVDMDELSQRYGIDAERARAFADAAGQWLNERFSGGDPLFGDTQKPAESRVRDSMPEDLDLDGATAAKAEQAETSSAPGPHPLDLPSEQQGLALSALDSGRWTVRPGNSQLAGTGTGADPRPSDVVGELRARDWITADGTLTLVGRHALGRWSHAAGESASPEPAPDA